MVWTGPNISSRAIFMSSCTHEHRIQGCVFWLKQILVWLARPCLGIGKHRRLDVEPPVARPVAAGEEGGAAVDAGLDVPQDLLELLLVDLKQHQCKVSASAARINVAAELDASGEKFSSHLRPLFDAIPEGVADDALHGAGLGLLDELVVHALVHERPRPGAAALALALGESFRIQESAATIAPTPEHETIHHNCVGRKYLVEEDRVVRELDGLVDVGVVHDDERGLATELQGHRLQVAPRRQFEDDLARARRSGERELVHAHVATQRGAGRRAKAGDHVQNTVGESSLRGTHTRNGHIDG
jgi:hypothetical protein